MMLNTLLPLLLLNSLAFAPHAAHAVNALTTYRAQRSRSTQLVQHFKAQHPSGNASRSDLKRKQLIFVALLPSNEADNKNDCIMPKVLPVLELGIAHVQRLGFPNALVDITLISRDSFCSSIYGPIGLFEIYTEWEVVNAVFGLSCEYVLAPISRYGGVWEIPVLTSGGNAAEFDKKADIYPTLTRLKGAQVNNLGNVVRAIIDSFNWTRTAVIAQNDNIKLKGNSVCFFCIQAVHNKLDKMSVWQKLFDTGEWKNSDIVRMLEDISKTTRIIIMCADPQSIRKIMLTAESMKMIDKGEYVFINIELFSRVQHLTTQPWFDETDTTENNERARKAYTAILTVTPKQPNDDEYVRVSNEIKTIAASKYNYTFQENEPISAFVTSFFDGVLLYANALNESIREDPTVLTRPINGTDMVRRMWNSSFTGITGNVTIDANGDRISAYSLLDMNPTTGRFEIVAHFLHNRLEYVPGKAIHWAGNRLGPPPDRPECGYDNSLCPDNSLPGYAILSLVLGIVVVVMTVGFILGYRHYRAEAEINSMSWRVSMDDVLCPDMFACNSRTSFHSSLKHSSQLTLISEDMGSFNAERQIFVPVGVYKGCKVAMKTIDAKNLNLTRSLMLELKRMKDLQHDHLVKFYGACLDPAKRFFLTEYCPKGSLQDILENEQFQLDWMFRLSLIHDIVRGMQFLHSSDIRSHGNLNSSNCVVDSRFVLKITDFGLHSMRKPRLSKESDIENCSYAYWSKLLWTAPELLRMEHNQPPEGSQKGDVYSFGIIVHEITTRQGPFFLGTTEPNKSPKDIIQLVKGYPKLTSYPFRPLADSSATYSDINNIMVKCWSEQPMERPDFNTLRSTIRKINKDNETGNIVDNLLKRMEQYANNLEELVEERTQDYLEEKKKCEKLLYQLLPQSVAAQLIRGQPVIAETFDQVTIYFSDIVGFTSISAESTPLQVVQFLNDLYTCFDSIVENFDVYKVETIGDAYMVVSGLPIRNGNQHAREIARLALALLQAVHSFQIHHRPNDHLKLRIGLHTGPCVAGVVGLKMPRYCLFGDTVNTASRMESNGEALKIHISEKTKLALDEFGSFITTRRGYVPMKGKGEMLTYWLEGEIPKQELTTSPRKMLLSRRSSLNQPHRSSLHKRHSELTALLPPYQLQQATPNNLDSPDLRVKRKISSSSPKLNGADYKTEGFHYFLEMLKPSHKEKQNHLKSKDGFGDVNSCRSWRETTKYNWELPNLRLPLSETLKNHNNNHIKRSYNQLVQSHSNSNLSGMLQPTARLRLKPSGSIHSGNRIKFNISSPDTHNNATNKELEDPAEDPDRKDVNTLPQPQLYNRPQRSNSGSSSTKMHLVDNPCSNGNHFSLNSNLSNNYNNIVKANNVKNIKLLCKSSANSVAEEQDAPNNDNDNALATIAATQPLLAHMNS